MPDGLIMLAQAAPQKAPLSPVVPSAPMPKAPASVSTIPSASPTAGTTSSTRQIEAVDLIDKLGLGRWADALTISILALVCAAVLSGVILAILRKAFGSAEESKITLESQEKQWFELITRKKKSQSKIDGLNKYVSALEEELGKSAKVT